MDLKVLVSHKKRCDSCRYLGRTGPPTSIHTDVAAEGRPLTFRRECIGQSNALLRIYSQTAPWGDWYPVGDSEDDTADRPSIFRAEVVGKNSGPIVHQPRGTAGLYLQVRR
jgi:hypothetical protein